MAESIIPAARKSRPKPRLCFVLDTSVLHTQSASDLLRADVVEAAAGAKGHTDVLIEWYLPEVVRHERQYQMIEAGVGFLGPVRKLERLLGHNLNITDDVVKARVEAVTEEQARTLGVRFLGLDCTRVNWTDLIRRACYREAPFSQGEEKGFRDAMILESFCQLLESSPSTPSLCRVALVSGDELMRKAAKERTTGRGNARILGSLGEAKGLINTVASNVPEDFVDGLRLLASKVFYEDGKVNCMYLKEKLGKRIATDFAGEMTRRPSEEMIRDNTTWTLEEPRFIRKRGQRVTWASRITIAATLSKMVEAAQLKHGFRTWSALQGGLVATPDWLKGVQYPPNDYGLGSADVVQPSVEPSDLSIGGLIGGASGGVTPGEARREKRIVGRGRTVVDVLWSATVTEENRLVKPTVERVEHIETTWE